MKRFPESPSKCVSRGCPNIPTIVLVGQMEQIGQSPRRTEIQVSCCQDHIEVAQEFTESQFPKIRFATLRNPLWLKKAQDAEQKNKTANL